MSIGRTEIANRALTKLGAQRITSLLDPIKEAVTMREMFDQVLDSELRKANWNFAMKRAKMPALADPPEFGYRYQYALPADFLKLVQVNEFYLRGLKERGPWALEQGKILTDYPAPLAIRYISRVSDPVRFDALFTEVLACRLAVEACEELTQSVQKRQMVLEDYKDAFMHAVGRDAIENPPDELPWGSWFDSRTAPATFATGPGAGSVNDIGAGWVIR